MFMSDIYLAQTRIDDLHREAAQVRLANQARQRPTFPVGRPIVRFLSRRKPAPTPQSRAA